MMSQQKQLLKRDLTVPQILRTYGKQFVQIRKQYSDGQNGRCALGLIMSYFGWNGKDEPVATNRLLDALVALGREGVSENLITRLNDSGAKFDEIADYLDRIEKWY
jgi:hypothetical protein